MSSKGMAIVDDARVAYRVQGRGPAIVLVNGTSALDVHWGPIIEEFSKSRTVISLDYSGSGETTDDGRVLSLKKLAAQVAAVARAAGATRFDLVGYSLGAAIAIQLASASPQLVRSLILVAGFASGAEPRLELQFRLWLDLVRHNRDAFTRLLVLSGLTPAFLSGAGSVTIEAMINGYISVANWDGIARQIELDLQVDVRAQARQLARPTLVIGCAHDQIVTTTRELADSIPGAAYREIAAGHLAYFEAAGVFMAAANDFLQQQPS